MSKDDSLFITPYSLFIHPVKSPHYNAKRTKPFMPTPQLDQALTFAQTNQANHLEELKAFLRIPSVSTQPEHKEDMYHAARWLAEKMHTAGLENIEIIESAVGRHPLVYADWLHAPNAPTVLIYGHFDVQPVEPLELWESPPFDPTIREDRLYARGASDDKGQAYIHVKAVEAYLQTSGSLPVNVKFIYEAEEEDGGLTLSDYLPKNQAKLAADVALISDTGLLGPDLPCIIYGLRGIHYDFFDLTGPDHDLHSGGYGGAINNPLNALGHILAKLKDEDGHILIPGFYEDVRELSAEERTLLNQLPLDEADFLSRTGAPALWGEPAYSLVERLGARPTLDVHGIIGGYTGAGGKTVLPSTVHCKISMRLVPDQDPIKIKQQFRDYVRQLTPPSITVTFGEEGHGAPASITDYTIPAMQAAREAYTAVFHTPPLLARNGGSIPVVGDFQTILGLESILMGFGLPGDRIHSPNESFYIPNFYRGIETSIHFLHHYGKLQ
jgi:acetylornithine deacetylase/succinyl-diaminopimelate desuccinylase-like protein